MASTLHPPFTAVPPSQYDRRSITSKSQDIGEIQADSESGEPTAFEPLWPRLGSLGDFWHLFDEAIEEYDNDMLDALKAYMDNLLIFVSPLDCQSTRKELTRGGLAGRPLFSR